MERGAIKLGQWKVSSVAEHLPCMYCGRAQFPA